MRDDEMTPKHQKNSRPEKIHCFADPAKVLDVILGQPSKTRLEPFVCYILRLATVLTQLWPWILLLLSSLLYYFFLSF